MDEQPIILPEELYDKMLTDAHNNLPNESCGILSGKDEKISNLYILPNQANSPLRFYVDEHTVATVLNAISSQSEEPLAIYHTHPTTNALPSKLDIHHHPDNKLKMIILSLKNKPSTISCFTIHMNGYQNCPLTIEGREENAAKKSY